MNSNRYLFKLFYLGNPFFGYQKQPNGNGIENHVEFAFVKSRYITSFQDAQYASISRTDRGVNAIMNCFTLIMQSKPDLKVLNSHIDPKFPIVIYDYALVSNNFNARNVKYKQYNYYIQKDKIREFDIRKLKNFIGKHDFYAFIKPDGAGKLDSTSEIYDINIIDTEGGYVIEFTGTKFGREQIRRMLGFALDRKFRRNNPEEFLNTNQQVLSIKPVSPYYLVLCKVEFIEEIDWQNPLMIDFIWNRIVDKLEQESFRRKIESLFLKELRI